MAVNLLTITAIVRTPQLRHSGQWQATLYVFSLAVADILTGFPSAWFAGLYVSETRAMMDDSYTLCLSGAIVAICVVACTNISLVAIAVDRLMYIVYPYFYQRFISERLVKTVILVIWVVSIATGCFVAPHFNNFEVYRCKPLTIFLSHDLKIFFIVFLVIQLLTTGACYVRIAFVARSQQRRIQMSKVQPLNKVVFDVKNLPNSSCRTSNKDVWFTRLAPPEKTEDVVLQPEVSSTVRALEAGTSLDIPRGQPVAEVMMCPENCSQSNSIVDIAIPGIGDNGRSDEGATNVSDTPSQNQTGNSVSHGHSVNLMTITTVLRTPQLLHNVQSQANLYVLNLAVADTLIGFSSVWWASMYISETRAMMDSNYALCFSGALLTAGNMSVATLTLISISLDRLAYIAYPYFYQRFISERLTKTFISIFWCSSLIGTCTLLFTNNNFETSGCKPLTMFLTYNIKVILNVLLLLQLLLTGACYLCIASVVRSQQLKIQAIRVHVPVVGVVNTKESSNFCYQTTHKDKAFTEAAQEVTVDMHCTSSQPEAVLRDTGLRGGMSRTTHGQPASGSRTDGTLHLSTASDTASPGIRVQARRHVSSTDVSPVALQNRTNKTASVCMFVAINILFSASWIPFVLISSFFR
ncbi:hypothetical protein C0Q70_10165 [Pomacea canaliculata]|uniref:G-protein coupled receptors family 1 profile domain-containing protein n=1 Tax=Pomacea canaliculata TaxID=400727 RepID=A0A2T7PBV0_POMCA|nr:hypothetical protein C0Q70_10165 [Pomacea canaliculata]